MQEPLRKEPRTVEEWKRKFHTEAKVNQELGRRLREMKLKSDDDTKCIEALQRQLEALKTHNQDRDGVEITGLSSCTGCVKLQAEVVKLRALLTKHNVPLNSSPTHASVMSKYESDVPVRERAGSLHRTHSILVRQQSGRIQCLRDMLDNLTPRLDSAPSSRRNSDLATAPAPIAPLELSTPPPTNTAPSTKKSHSTKTNQQTETKLLTGIEDTSLGDLFKYVIVLSGPVAPRPKKNAFSSLSSRFKAADFRRTRSGSEPPVPDPTPPPPPKPANVVAKPMATTTPATLPPNSKTSSSPALAPPVTKPQTLQDFVADDTSRVKAGDVAPPGSPMKRAGWLSNIVPPRFRAASADAPPVPILKDVPVVAKSVVVDSPAKPVVPTPQKPKMLGLYPPTKGTVAELEGLVEICFPYGERMPPLSDFSVTNLRRTLQERHRTYRSPDSTFVLTIASATHPTEITYAVCVHTPLFPEDEADAMARESESERLPTHGCICLLSPYPFFSLFFKIVFGIATIWESKRRENAQDYAIALKEKKPPPRLLTMTDFVDHFTAIASKLKNMKVPAMGGWSRLVLAPQYTPLAFHRPHSENVKAERRMLALEYAAPMLFALLSVDQVLFLLGCLCCERKVLVVSDHANIVSCCVLALITLLEPLQWAGPVITLLPPRLDELLEAPVPLIAGRVSMDSATIPNFSTLTTPMNGVIEMNMDQNNLCMHEEDLMSYHELKLPGCDALVHELQHLSTRLFEHHLDPDFPSIEQMQACEIICSRIYRHMKSLCALATGESTTLDVCDLGYSVTPRKGDVGSGFVNPAAARRCSETVEDYVRRLKETQMFSMFSMQRHDEKEEEEEEDDDDETVETGGSSNTGTGVGNDTEEEEDDDDDDDDATECTETEALFPDEAITYEVHT